MKFVYALVAVSLLMIAFGLYMVIRYSEPVPIEVTEPPTSNLGVIPAPVPKEQSDSEIPQVAPEVGTEEWCDLMMYKANDLWTDDDTKSFAENCIYQ